MKIYRNQPNFFLRLASVLTKDNRHILEDLFNTTSSWPIDFHELILVRDIPTKEQLELKEDYKRLSKMQHDRASRNWIKSFNGKLFEKIYLETIKRIDSNKVYSPCLAGGRFVEIFPDGGLSATFEALQRAPTPGQSLVLYDDTHVLGGGVIEQVL